MGEPVRAGEYADIVHARLLVNLGRNCEAGGALSCWEDEAATAAEAAGEGGGGGRAQLRSKLEAAGWQRIGHLDYQLATAASGVEARLGRGERSEWLAFTVIAPW